jgi:hypothetical protein
MNSFYTQSQMNPYSVRRKKSKKSRRRKRRRILFFLVIILISVLLLSNYVKPLQEIRSELSLRIERLFNTDLDNLPENLQNLLEHNPETLDFVKGYASWDGTVGTISPDELTGEVPLFLQWDTRWGYVTYGSDLLAITGCGPTCMSMVYTYLTGDISRSPKDMAEFSESMGYYVPGSGTDWAFMTDGAAQLGLSSRALSLSEDIMISELQAGHPIICSMGPGDFTDSGHFIVIRGYENGAFLVNDPFSVIRSEQTWTYDTLAPQILNLWAFSLA